MKKRIVRRGVLPELYVHLELKRNLSREEEARIRYQIADAAGRIFWESFGKPAWTDFQDRHFRLESQVRKSGKLPRHKLREQNPSDYQMIVNLEEGSLKIKVVPTLAAIYFAVGAWGSFVTGAEDIASRLRWAYDQILPHVHDAVGENNIEREIRHERRIGAIGRFDELVQEYQRGHISHDNFMEEGNALLQKIAQSEDRQVLLPLICHYLEQQYGIQVDIPEEPVAPWNLPDTPINQRPILGPIMLPMRWDEE